MSKMYDDTKVNVDSVLMLEQWFKDHTFLPEKIGKILKNFVKSFLRL